jgi:NAD(P)-dependent dehydrogenase (short-subunit alcohol dehydrogenase family)
VAMFDQAERDLGPLRALVNSAGVDHHGRVESFRADDLTRLLAVNSKAAVDAFTTGPAREVAADGIRVNAVRPGMTRTIMTAHLQADPMRHRAVVASIPMRRLGRPEEVAEAIVWLLSDQAAFVTGAHLDISGGGFLVRDEPASDRG